jgi:sortase (surface protein transpeptidase)
VSRRATAAFVAESTLGAAVLVVGLITVAASATAPAAGPAAVAPPSTASDPAQPKPTTTSTPMTVAIPASTVGTAPMIRPKTTPTSTTAAPKTAVAPVVTHRATIDALTPRPVAVPVRVSIPALAVDGPVFPAGVNGENELDVPPDARSLVWYRHGPSPGERGSAVIAGHLNWRGATGLFADLASTPVGAAVTVVYDDGSQRLFTVTSVDLVPKPAVSMNGVFDRDGARLLRLVTCGGEFDDQARSYLSNVVVTAVPA